MCKTNQMYLIDQQRSNGAQRHGMEVVPRYSFYTTACPFPTQNAKPTTVQYSTHLSALNCFIMSKKLQAYTPIQID